MSSLAAPNVSGMAGEREVNNAWATWLAQRMRAVGLPTPSDLARASGGQPDQSVVSRWLNEGRTPTIDLLRRVEGPLKTPLLELMVRAGHITAAEAKMTRELAMQTVDVPDAIREDPALIEEARAHLLNQYELLRRLSSPDAAAARPLRAAARKKPPRRPST